MSYFEACNLVKQYANHRALDNVSIHVPKGSVYGLLGPNGAGKTTLIRIINGITAPDSGDVIFDGKKFSIEDTAKIGYLPEERGLYKKMKVGEQALYLAKLKGLSKKEAHARLKEWFEKFEITEWWHKKVEELSKGMAQKVQFITTVLHDPELLIFDEPFSGFDPVNANLLKNEVLQLKEQGKTIILSTHDMGSVEELCDNITLINKSRAVLEGRVSEVRQKYKGNLYELVFSGDKENLLQHLNGDFHVYESISFGEDKHSITFQIDDSKKSNLLIKKAVELVIIHEFREILPSMNEVFIKAVSETQTPQTNEQA
jgi:ABC-2 type transport system ATP-binding protein